MGPVLSGLIKLQSVENRLRAAKAKLARSRRSVTVQENQVRSLQSALEAKKEECQLTKLQSERLELELKTRDQEVSKLRASLNAAKTNKEYAAVLTQLNTDKANATKIEDQVLTSLNRVDELKRQQTQHREALEGERARLADLERGVRDIEAKLSSQLEELEQQREAAANEIPPQALIMFERARDKHDGEAMAVVEQPHPRRTEYNCSGCNMSITLETVNALQSRDEVQMCQTCSRILYLETPSSVSAR